MLTQTKTILRLVRNNVKVVPGSAKQV